MLARIKHLERDFTIDLNAPLDISLPLLDSQECVNAWYVDQPSFSPVMTERFVGSVKEGGDVNFRNISFNPHGNGTHTECVGHIAEQVYNVNDVLKTSFFFAELITVKGTVVKDDEGDYRKKDDVVIELHELSSVLEKNPEALIIRTLPNQSGKRAKKYSNSNPPYLCHKAAEAIRTAGVKHLLIDLPSVDRELDGGALLSHRAFWNYPGNPRMDATITELIFVKNAIEDGSYIVNIQIAPFVNDASPSKPVLYQIL